MYSTYDDGSILSIVNRMLKDRIVFLNGPITDETAHDMQAKMLYLASADAKAPIHLYINSPGGSVTAGLAIYDTMQLISPPVETVCAGMAASMAAVLLCAGAEGKRSILPHSRVMIHQPHGGAYGQTTDVLIAAREIETARAEIVSIIAKHTHQDPSKVLADVERDYWMSAEDARQYGIVDQVLAKG